MPSPITPPWDAVGTNCFAVSTGKFANELMPVSERRRRASGPETKKFTMWCVWSYSTAVSRHAFCSRRQFVNSAGTTG